MVLTQLDKVEPNNISCKYHMQQCFYIEFYLNHLQELTMNLPQENSLSIPMNLT